MLTIKTHYNGYNFSYNGQALAPVEITPEMIKDSNSDDLLKNVWSSNMTYALKNSAARRIRDLFNIEHPKLNIAIDAKRWTDRNGNTYHTVSVLDVDATKGYIFQSEITHGYDEEYLQTAQVALVSILSLKYANQAPRVFFEKNNINVVEEIVTDVKRKMDL